MDDKNSQLLLVKSQRLEDLCGQLTRSAVTEQALTTILDLIGEIDRLTVDQMMASSPREAGRLQWTRD